MGSMSYVNLAIVDLECMDIVVVFFNLVFDIVS